MPFTVRDAIAVNIGLLAPSITSWSRLEVLPSTGDLQPGLEARLADPLWLLGRQWQLNEFQGEDAGTPVDVRLSGVMGRLARYLPGPLHAGAAERARDYQHESLPLETLIECEPIRASHPRLAAEAGLHFLRLLTAEGAGHLRQEYLRLYPLAPLVTEDADADPRGAAWALLFEGRALDGRKLAADLKALADAELAVANLPAEPAVAPADKEPVQRAAQRWLRWFAEAVTEPVSTSAWNPQRQEYALALSARMPGGPVAVTAAEYTDGRLDWYSFQAADGAALGEPAQPVPPQEMNFPALLPAPVAYPGMPADRYWEFEDARVNLATIDAGPTDLLRLLLVEFALVYGNDWFVVPLDLPVGSLFQVTTFQVRDTFGVTANVQPSRNRGGTPWTMFELTTQPGAAPHLSHLFLLAPTLPFRLEGDPIEQVALLRDEMANLVWTVERKVQGASGEPRDRSLEAGRRALHQRLDPEPDDAEVIYRLATPVPEPWIPFVPVPAAGVQNLAQFAVQLERRALQRTLADGTQVTSHPRGLLLRTDASKPVEAELPLRLEEEEVPREGAMVERTFQFTRGIGGGSYLWVGRRKRVGRGEGSSGLRFDTADRRRAGG